MGGEAGCAGRTRWVQAPQLAMLVARSTHALPHACGIDPLHWSPQALATQVAMPDPALGGGHVLHAPPPTPVPHSITVWAAVTQPLLPQQPVRHEAPSQATHAPA